MTDDSQSGSGFDMEESFDVRWRHVLKFTSDAFAVGNPSLANALAEATDRAETRRMIAVFDAGVVRSNPGIEGGLRGYLGAHADRVPHLEDVILTPGGEVAKQGDELVDRVLESISENSICRKSVVLVIGGGAVLDAAGYAAAVAHRGVRLVRMPTTVLGQCDSGVGVKNGINRFGKKNFVGAFVPPCSVLCDQELLRSLEDPDWTSGFSEVVKIALLKDPGLFAELERNRRAISDRDLESAMPLIARSGQLHMEHITRGGDPFELNEARPLDFGHWSAHKLEQMTDFRLRHGDAVSIGIALDMVYGGCTGLTDPALVDRSLQLLAGLGLPVFIPELERTVDLAEGLEEFREHLGGELTITMVRDVGDPVDLHEIDLQAMSQAVTELKRRSRQLQQDGSLSQ